MSEFSEVVFTPGLNLGTPLLVEASAGTGKTYNIQNVYLRLILQEGLSVQQILVVTFTNAATQELRERLRSVLLLCRYELDSPSDGAQPASEQQRIRDAIDLANPGKNPACLANLKKRVQIALMDFDSAAIFTIHGFCQRVLERYAFECGHDPDAELMPEQSGIVREACQDWWRQHTYSNGDEQIPFGSLGELMDMVSTVYQNPLAELKGSSLPDSEEFKALITACQTAWQEVSSLRGHIVWVGNGKLCRAGKSTADITPIAEVVSRHASAFTDWEMALPPPGDVVISPIRHAAMELLTIARNIPGTGDAKSVAEHLKTMSTSAWSNMALSKRASCIAEIVQRIRDRIQDRAALTYEAMLANVHNVLQNGSAGLHLRELLRGEFRAALIDEFQDTDPIQYNIFWLLFGPGQDPARQCPPLVFVGDPKQAIYGFRGGDIFTYYQAKGKIPVGDQHTLGKNFRSEAHLVAAINTLFNDDPTGEPTFLNPNVPYAEDLAAHDVDAEKELLVGGDRDDAPLKIWRLPDDGHGNWAEFVARETVNVLSDETLTIGGKDVRPRHIAILVMKHWEAAEVQQALLKAGVNAVRQSTGNVFDAEVAAPLALVMQAMLEPGRAGIVRSALGSGLLPCTPAQLAQFNAEEDACAAPMEADASRQGPDRLPTLPIRFEEWIEVFRDAGLHWNKYSFMEGFQHLANRLNLLEHVARQPEGDRRLSDLRHLVELIHQAARAMRLGPVALSGWFTRQLDPGRRDAIGEDDSKPRIASDDDAVQIMTVFKSKGLQFPIVFVPTLWAHKSTGKRRSASMVKYHEDNKLVLDLDTSSAGATQTAKRENHEESIRMGYVALTRAINRTYLFESDKNSEPANFALAHLLKRLPALDGEGEIRHGHVLRRTAPINLPALPWQAETRPLPESLQARRLSHPVDNRHGHASYSSLTAHGSGKTSEGNIRDVDDLLAPASEIDIPDPSPIFTIPGGAKLGECWHEIFENIDFEDLKNNSPRIHLSVEQALDKYRICPPPRGTLPADKHTAALARRAAVHTMVENTLSVPLQADSAETPFALQAIPRSHRRSEMEFGFSLQRTHDHAVCGLAGILEKHWRGPVRDKAFISELQTRESSIPKGFMTGFIDLVFHRNDRFYIVDWKSNRLNGRADGFGPDGLAAEMRRHSYYLQYLIYVVALHGFLSAGLAGYDYDHHFGGVFYLFLRGIDGESRNGVFADKPSKALVEALSTFLGGSP